MGLFYVGYGRNLTLTAAAQDIYELQCSANAGALVHGYGVTSNYNVDERLDVQHILSSGTAGTGGSAGTIKAREPLNTVASAVTGLKHLVTTPGVAGTNNGQEPDQWSQLAPYGQMFTPETRIKVQPLWRLRLNLANSLPAASRTINYWILWEE